MGSSPPHILSYESAVGAPRRWGPWVWRPSVLSIVLAVVVVVLAVWVKCRHEPWATVRTIQAAGSYPATMFVHNGRLIAASGMCATVWDLADGRCVGQVTLPSELITPISIMPPMLLQLCGDGTVRMHAAWAATGAIFIDLQTATIKRQETAETWPIHSTTRATSGQVLLEWAELESYRSSLSEVVQPPAGMALVWPPCLSKDGRRLAIPLCAQNQFMANEIGVWEMPSRRLLYCRANTPWLFYGQVIDFFPDSSRALIATTDGACICRDTPRPIAIFPGPDEPSSVCVSTDGQTVAIEHSDELGSGQVTIWRKVGGECRESILGILGMPHVWGLIAASGLVALVTWRDALRTREPAGAVMSATSLTMVLVGAGLSLVLFLEWCIGRREPNVGPALLVCGLGLAVGGRGWRWLAILVLAGCLGLGGFGIQSMIADGLRQAVVFRVLDRVWDVPRWWVAGFLSAGLATAAGAVAVVARKV